MASSIEESLRLKFALAQVNKVRHTEYNFLKPKQVDCLKYALQNSDVLGVLPTGYWKSLIVEMMPYLRNAQGAVIIISPLNSIIVEQQERLGNSAITVEEDFAFSPAVRSFKQAKHRFVLCHPEHILCKPVFDILRDNCKDKLFSGVQSSGQHFKGLRISDRYSPNLLSFPSPLQLLWPCRGISRRGWAWRLLQQCHPAWTDPTLKLLWSESQPWRSLRWLLRPFSSHCAWSSPP